jgi:hypothetical protein
VVTHVLNLAVILLLAVMLLLPRPDAKVKPALEMGAENRTQVVELQTRLLAAPEDTEAALRLSDIFLDERHPDWALAVLQPAVEAHPNDHRLHWRRSLALAEHFAPAGAHQAATRALALCQTGSARPCGDATLARLQILESTLARVKDIDMRQDPNTAKKRLIEAMHPTYLRKPRKKAAADAGS